MFSAGFFSPLVSRLRWRGVCAWLGLPVLLMLAVPSRGSEFPGAPPDCWNESRLVHTGDEGRYWEKNTQISRFDGPRPKGGETSPNKGYAFIRQGEWPRARILVDAEKGYLISIEFSDLQGLGNVSWINEKLLFIRVWWGRVAGTDLVFDVEAETLLYTEQFYDGYLARQQFIERCPTTGCTCIMKK